MPGRISSSGRPMSRSISCARLRGSALGRSILLMTGDDRQVVLEGQIDVGHRLRLDPLRGIDDEERAFARGEAAAHLVREVDVAAAYRSS